MKKRMALISTLFIGFTSCSSELFTASNTTLTAKDQENSVIPVQNALFGTKADQQPQLLTFESKITQQTMNIINTAELPADSFQEFSLKVHGSKRDAVMIPQNGTFEIIFQQGNTFQILDGDARDGQALIQLPPYVLDTYMTVLRDANGKGAEPSALFEDKLYYVKHDIKETDNNKGGWRNLEGDDWYHIGKRQLPINFNNNYGNDKYTLKFNNKGIKDILFRFYSTDSAEPDYPAGVKKIGGNGGTVELPGVGKVEIPEGALNNETLISLTQELQSYEVLNYSVEDTSKQMDYISPVLKLAPLGLKLNYPAKVYLETNLQRLGNNTPLIIS